MGKSFWVSFPMAAGQVDTDKGGIIVAAPPMWHRFIGKPFWNLEEWLRNFYRGELEVKELQGG